MLRHGDSRNIANHVDRIPPCIQAVIEAREWTVQKLVLITTEAADCVNSCFLCTLLEIHFVYMCLGHFIYKCERFYIETYNPFFLVFFVLCLYLFICGGGVMPITCGGNWRIIDHNHEIRISTGRVMYSRVPGQCFPTIELINVAVQSSIGHVSPGIKSPNIFS